MASINQLVSEIAHSLQQADSVPVRRAIRLAVIHTRNQLIRQSFEQHRFLDKVTQQAFRITLIDVPDGDIANTESLNLPIIKRSKQRVPRPVRLNEDLPFRSVRTLGLKSVIEVPYIKAAAQRFYSSLPGFCHNIAYDYINQYIYLNVSEDPSINTIGSIVIEAAFENPFEIPDEHIEGTYNYSDDDEFMISEDMIGSIKKLVIETINPEVIMETNEIPTINLAK